MAEFAVTLGDVTDVPSDLLLLKHAQEFFGADRAVASRLISAGLCSERHLRVAQDECVVLETRRAISPRRVMFLGTARLGQFGYDEMENFACLAIAKIADLRVPAAIVTTTVHGTGYGLDGGESLQRLVRGFQKGLASRPTSGIQKIMFVTLASRAERMLNAALEAVAGVVAAPALTAASVPRSEMRISKQETPAATPALVPTPEATPPPGEGKKRVFVAMPFSEEFQNVYEFGIYPAVRNCGFICERVDEAHFTGDVLGRIRHGIESADLVIADLSEGRPNVYLEVGYAWGRSVPVIFVARKGEKLHFDVSTHRCIFYGRFSQFAKDLAELITGVCRTAAK